LHFECNQTKHVIQLISITQLIVLSLATQARFFKKMANELVLQVTPQSVVIVAQNEGKTSL